MNIFEFNKAAAYDSSLYISVFILYHSKRDTKCSYINLVEFISKDIEKQRFEDVMDLIAWTDEKMERFNRLIGENLEKSK